MTPLVVALNKGQCEALGELLNVALGLTAAKLSDITGQRVALGEPVVASRPVGSPGRELQVFETGEVLSIHQGFTGQFSGDAVLILDTAGAAKLADLFADENLPTDEILNEVGNMLLSACLSVFSNIIQAHVSFSVPVLHRQSLRQLQASLAVPGPEPQYAVDVTPSFQILQQGIAGRIVVILGESSLKQLIAAVEQWEGHQVPAR